MRHRKGKPKSCFFGQRREIIFVSKIYKKREATSSLSVRPLILKQAAVSLSFFSLLRTLGTWFLSVGFPPTYVPRVQQTLVSLDRSLDDPRAHDHTRARVLIPECPDQGLGERRSG